MLLLLLTLLMLGFEKKDNIFKIIINSNFPMVKDDGELLNISDNFCVFYNEKYILYEFPITVTVEVNHKLIKTYYKYQYFGFRKNEANGIFYDSLNVKQFRYFSVDSILTARAFKKMNLYDDKNDVLVEKLQQSNGQIIEKYICKEKRGFSYPDTTFIYYSDKLKHIEYSFSKELDSLKGMKVQKIVALFNAQQYAGMPVKFPERRLSFEMNEVPITNLEEIKSAFERLKKDYKTLNK